MSGSRTRRAAPRLRAVLVSLAALWAGCATAPPAPSFPGMRGPLRVHPENRRYFTDDSGRAIYLAGAHTWNNVADMGTSNPPPAFDFAGHLDYLEHWGHNFTRLWAWESTTWNTKGNQEAKLHHVAPHPFARTGPGTARDGKPRFDLSRFDPAYFQRLRARVEAAGRRGIYASVMLFEGWGLQFSPGAWESHPFHPDNNVNGLDGDADGDGKGLEVHELVNPAATRLQEAYVRKVVETVNDLDNVLYEISNENHPASTAWQAHMIRFVKEIESSLPARHPVGMTFQYRGGANAALFASPADWVSPNREGGWRDDPPPADGAKVVLNDTDHLWGIGGNAAWVWKTLTRGHHALFMDPYDGSILGSPFDPRWKPILRALGQTVRFARRLDLAAAAPCPELASTGFCLANPGKEYLVYLPAGGETTVELEAGNHAVEWFDPERGETRNVAPAAGPGPRRLQAPFAGHAVLYLRRE